MMKKLTLLFAATPLLAVSAVPAVAQSDDGRELTYEQEARIPFANSGGIRNWEAVGNDTLYIEGRRGQWYRAELMGYCPDLNFSVGLGFETNVTGSFDRFSSVYTREGRCEVSSLVKSDPPPGYEDKKKSED